MRHIERENWPIEARLMAYFRRTFVVYNGVEMHKDNPKDIVAAQRVLFFLEGDQKYSRIPYGEEPGWLEYASNFAEIPCHDCGVVKGQYHTYSCDMEECPKCHSQLLSCGCWWA